MPEVGVQPLYARYLQTLRTPYAPTSRAFTTAGRVFLTPVDVPWPVIVDAIVYEVGSVRAGNVRGGIYRVGATVDSPAGGVLVVESVSIAQSGVYLLQVLSLADTLLVPGQYFLGLQGSDATGTYFHCNGVEAISPWWHYDVGGGYGAFTNPCPVVVADDRPVIAYLRVKTNFPIGYRL